MSHGSWHSWFKRTFAKVDNISLNLANAEEMAIQINGDEEATKNEGLLLN